MAALAALSASAFVFVVLAYVIRMRSESPTEARLHRLSAQREVVVTSSDEGRPLLRRSASSIPALSRLLSTSRYAATWAFDIERAGVSLRVGEYFLIRVIAAAVAFFVTMLVLTNGVGLLIACLLAAVAYMLPAFWLHFRIKRRLDRISAQLVETITLIANALKAGFAFAQAMAVTSQRVGPPMSIELNRALLDINLGASTEDALSAMNERIGSDDVDIVVTAILIQRNTGGNLAEVLERVTETMRDREKVQGDIKTLTSQQRLAGWVLSLWPVALGLIFLAINPSMMSLMWTTGPGIVMLVIWATLTALAAFTYRRILAIDI